MSELMARLTQPLPPIKVVAPEATPAIDAIITKCLQLDPADRYQTTAELLKELESLDANGHPIRKGAVAGARASRWTTWAAAALAVVALAALGGAWWLAGRRGAAEPAAREPVSVLIANFDNRAKDPVFDGLIEQALSVGIEGASFVTAYPRRDALRLASQLPGGALDVNTAKLISIREGIDVVLGGSIAQDGRTYRLTVQAIEPDGDKTILDWTTDAGGKDEVLAAVGKMAAKVRNELGDTTVDPEHIRNQETFTARSLEAARAYAAAQELQWAGKYQEAIAKYEEAVKLDPELGRAYAGLASTFANLGRRDEAEQYYQTALSKIDRMTDREKYRTRGGYYLFARNSAKALEEFRTLIEKYPADTAGLTNLAFANFQRRDFKTARDLGRKASTVFPNNVLRKNNVALYAMYAGDFETAEREATEVLKLNPEYVWAFVAIALSQLAAGRQAEAAETYRKLEPVSAAGRTFATSGLADLAMYEGRLRDAEKILEPAVAAALAGQNRADAARWRVSLAYLRLKRGDTRQAIEDADRAVSISTELGVVFLAGRVYLDAGRVSKVLELISALGSRLDDEPQIYAKLLEGEVAFKQGKTRDALQRFQEAQKIGDSWLGRYDMGRAYLEAGAFTEAYSEFDACLKRRGEATAVFLDDNPTYRFFVPVYYYLGRAQEGLKSPAAAESYRTFLAIKQNGDEQGLVADGRRRVGVK
jgi:tetratricopeptide (TPR) repeat protein